MMKRTDLKIPYGVSDFKTIRNEGLYYVDIAAKAEEGIAQLKRYASDRFVPELARDTKLHLILYQFQGTELIRLEEIVR